MGRDSQGLYTLPANTLAVTGNTIEASKFNTLVNDLELDANTIRPVLHGGTGVSSLDALKTALGVPASVSNATWSGGALSIVNGGTGATTAAAARTALGLNPVPIDSGGTGATTISTARQNFGLGQSDDVSFSRVEAGSFDASGEITIRGGNALYLESGSQSHAGQVHIETSDPPSLGVNEIWFKRAV